MNPRSARGFTLVELLIVIAIIAILLSLLIPAFGQARQAFDNTRCRANMRSLSQAIHMYAQQNFGALPPNCNDAKSWLQIVKKDSAGTWAPENQKIGGLLAPFTEGTPAVYQCPTFAADDQCGGGRVICHFAIPTILSGMSEGLAQQAFYFDPYTTTSSANQKWLRSVPLIVEPLVKATTVPPTAPGHISNSLGVFDPSSNLWTTLPNGGFQQGGKLAFRHFNMTNVGYIDGSASESITFPDQTIPCEKLYMIVNSWGGSVKKVNFGDHSGPNKYGSWIGLSDLP